MNKRKVSFFLYSLGIITLGIFFDRYYFYNQTIEWYQWFSTSSLTYYFFVDYRDRTTDRIEEPKEENKEEENI
jgi:hypothetical protein